MARTTSRRPGASAERTLRVVSVACPHCGAATRSAYVNDRAVSTLAGVVALHLHVHVRCCQTAGRPLHHRPRRPEEEGRVALPRHEFGLDVVALVGALRYRQHCSVPEIHLDLLARGLVVCQRTVTNLLGRCDELLAVRLGDGRRPRELPGGRGRVVLALDGLLPDVGHEVLWVLRDCISGEVLLARSLLGSTENDLAALIEEVKRDLALAGPGKKGAKGAKGVEPGTVPIVGVVSDGQQHSIRNAVAKALPGVPHQLCQFHHPREAARLIYETDRHAKKEPKKHVRGIRPIERAVEAKAAAAAAGDAQAQAQAGLGYCPAVRSAITDDDGKPPLDCSGLDPRERLDAVSTSLATVARDKGGRCVAQGTAEAEGDRGPRAGADGGGDVAGGEGRVRPGPPRRPRAGQRAGADRRRGAAAAVPAGAGRRAGPRPGGPRPGATCGGAWRTS